MQNAEGLRTRRRHSCRYCRFTVCCQLLLQRLKRGWRLLMRL